MYRFLNSPTTPPPDVLQALQNIRDNQPPSSDASEAAWSAWAHRQVPLLVIVSFSSIANGHNYLQNIFGALLGGNPIPDEALLLINARIRLLRNAIRADWGDWVEDHCPGRREELYEDSSPQSKQPPPEDSTSSAIGMSVPPVPPRRSPVHSQQPFPGSPPPPLRSDTPHPPPTPSRNTLGTTEMGSSSRRPARLQATPAPNLDTPQPPPTPSRDTLGTTKSGSSSRHPARLQTTPAPDLESQILSPAQTIDSVDDGDEVYSTDVPEVLPVDMEVAHWKLLVETEHMKEWFDAQKEAQHDQVWIPPYAMMVTSLTASLVRALHSPGVLLRRKRDKGQRQVYQLPTAEEGLLDGPGRPERSTSQKSIVIPACSQEGHSG